MAKKIQAKSDPVKRNAAILKRLEEFTSEAERRAKSPSVQRAFRRKWQHHIESEMLRTKNGYDDGDENGMWDALLFCLQTKTPIPAPWPAEALERYARGRIAAKKKRGRPAKWLRDLIIFDLVNYWRKEQIVFGRKKKSRHFSESRAFKMVQKQLEEDGESLSLHSLKNAYNRIKRMRRSKSQPPYVSPFET